MSATSDRQYRPRRLAGTTMTAQRIVNGDGSRIIAARSDGCHQNIGTVRPSGAGWEVFNWWGQPVGRAPSLVAAARLLKALHDA